jgi:hypothetical protein
MIVTTNDLQPIGYCARGAVRFAKQHNLDWKKFVTEGLPEEVLLATGDALAVAFVENARRRASEVGK